MLFDKLSEINEDLWSYLAKTNKKIVMYGTGNGADKILNVFNDKNIPLYGIFASDDFVRGQEFRGFKVKKYLDFVDELNDFIVVVSFASQRDEVLKNIYKIDNERELYAPDVPVFGEGIFDLEYFNSNKVRLRRIYDRLADELSMKTFVNTLAFKLTGKISYLKECETNKEETYSLLSANIRNKNYIDIGAYTGDTVEEYTELFGKNMNLYAFEPDIKNYRKMILSFQEKNINCSAYNFAAWNKEETVRFYSNSGRAGSASSGNRKIKYIDIQGMPVDNIIKDNIGFIKIDAEGSDVNVVNGMKRIIKHDRPCIKIAAYHRNDDYFTLPETILGINPNYKIYMRHLKYIPGWDTDFIFSDSKD